MKSSSSDVIRRSVVGLMLALELLAIVGCGSLTRSREPTPCRQVFNATRCLAMTDWAAARLQATRADIAVIDVIPAPTAEIRNGVTILQNYGGGTPFDVRVTLRDGSAHIVSMECQGDPQPSQLV